MRAILHIGTEKTGTSSIQRFLRKNREEIADQGFFFLESTGLTDDRKLSAYCLLDGEFDDFHRNNLIDTQEKKHRFEQDFVSQFKREMDYLPKGIHTVLISSEHFHSRARKPEHRQKLRTLLDQYFKDYMILCYLRPQIEVAVSHYSTYLKAHGINDLGDYISQCKPENYYYDYWKMLCGWEEDFPRHDLIVRLFGKHDLVDGDVLADFCYVVRLDYASLHSVPPANESVTPTGQEILKLVNKTFPPFIERLGRNPRRTAFQQAVSNSFQGRGKLPHKQEAERIQASFSDINEKIRARWFPDRRELFHINFDAYDQKPIIHEDIVSCFEAFFNNIASVPSWQLSGIPVRLIDSIVDAALHLEKYGELEKAKDLVQVAQILKPKSRAVHRHSARIKGAGKI